MKFGGTSVGDASRIAKVVEIVREAADHSDLVVVVSALAGVTNRLVEAADRAEAGQGERVGSIFNEIRGAHEAVANALLHSDSLRSRIQQEIVRLAEEGRTLCGDAASGLTGAMRDSVLSLGERLSAPIVAAALSESGIRSESIEATELVVTNACHGSAEPVMDATRRRCEARLQPLLEQRTVPVVTGFIGATIDGALTTLGRGGSDYSATILGAALDADEVIIWTDVDGLMTADPRLVPDACTISEISYQEAAEFARCGAKVLHPKTLSPVECCGVPVLIRNTFAPALPGTRITLSAATPYSGVKGLAVNAPADQDFAIVSLVGRNLNVSDRGRRLLATLKDHGMNANIQSSSDCSVSFAVARQDVTAAVRLAHREFELAGSTLQNVSTEIRLSPSLWQSTPAQGTASAD